MATFDDETCRAALDASILSARLPKRLVDMISKNGFADETGRLDNVSIPTYLHYLAALGLTVEPRQSKPVPKPKGADKLEGFMSDHGVG